MKNSNKIKRKYHMQDLLYAEPPTYEWIEKCSLNSNKYLYDKLTEMIATGTTYIDLSEIAKYNTKIEREKTMKNLIPWNMIDNRYKHARMDATKKVYVYRNSPKISVFGNSWVDAMGDYINITDLMTGDISELDWKTFKATRPEKEKIKVETKKMYYTQKEFDNGVNAPIGSTCILLNDQGFELEYGANVVGKEVIVLSDTLPCIGPISVQTIEHASMCYCFRSSMLKPIEIRTAEEKLIDDVANFLIDIDEDVLLHNNEAYVHDMAVKLISASKFTITKKGD